MKEQTAECPEFNLVLLEAIDETLSIFGEKTKSALYVYLTEAFSLPKREIPKRIHEFSKALEELFQLGSKNLEILIMKNLHSKVGVVWESKPSDPWIVPDLTFTDYVSFIKKYFADTRNYEERMSIIISENEALKMYK